MDFHKLKERALLHYEKKLPFVVFSLPNSEVVKAFFQNNDKFYPGYKLDKDGFVLCPFHETQRHFLIPKADSEYHQVMLEISEFATKHLEFPESEKEQIFHKNLIRKTIGAIKQGVAEKIVISRQKNFVLSNFSVEILMERFFSAYPSAFRYVWFHPKTGLWCGATPEILVKIRNNEFKTMALAGTQPYKSGQIKWREKELAEQHFVTQAILENVNGKVQDIHVSETYSHRAGNLLHLRTDISGTLPNLEGSLSKLAGVLHPTPAVCGTPREIAKSFILANEGYHRKFYTGFLGPIEDGGTSATLMVNLRCMKIENGKASVFVGGGITADSDSTEEWGETQNKMQTMLQVLQPML